MGTQQLPSLQRRSLLRPKLLIYPNEPRRPCCRIRKRRRTSLLLGQELLVHTMGCRRLHQDGPKPRKSVRYCQRSSLPYCLKDFEIAQLLIEGMKKRIGLFCDFFEDALFCYFSGKFTL